MNKYETDQEKSCENGSKTWTFFREIMLHFLSIIHTCFVFMGTMLMLLISYWSQNSILTTFCNLKLYFSVFYCLLHKTVKKIMQRAVDLLLCEIFKKGWQKSYISNLQRIQKYIRFHFFIPFCNLKLYFLFFSVYCIKQ